MTAPSYKTRLEKQAKKHLDEDTTAVELVSRLDFGYISGNDQYTDWHASTPLEPMVRALFLKELEDLSYSELHRRLTDEEETAESLGFEEVPARTTFGRAWRDRFDDNLKEDLEFNAERIRTLAHQQGCSIGLDAISAEDKTESSQRTKDRFIAEKTEEVTEEMQRLVFPAWDFQRRENAHYDTECFLELQSHLGLAGSAAESGSNLYSQDTEREDAPDADTHLRNIKRLTEEEIQGMIEESIGRMVHEAKKNLEFDRPAEAAIDMTYVAYYGDRDEVEMVQGAPDTKEYDWCYKFATLTIVGENVKFTLAMKPVERGYTIGEVVRDLIWQAKEHVNISKVYADAEFCSADAIDALEAAGLRYIIPSPKNSRVKRHIERMTQDVEVRQDYAIHGKVKGEASNTRKTTNLVLVRLRLILRRRWRSSRMKTSTTKSASTDAKPRD